MATYVPSRVLVLGVVGDQQLLTTSPVVDPSAGGGLAAPLNSVYFGTSVYLKTGAGATAWTAISLLTNGTALSVYGVTGNANAPRADIVAGSDGDVLRRSGTALGFGTIPESSVTNLVSDLALKAPLASPTFTGTPAAPTAATGTSTTQLATTAFVASAVAAPINNVTGVMQNPLFATGASGLKNYGDSAGGAIYLGRLPVALSAATLSCFYRTTTALVIGTTGTRWAEIGIATGAINPGGNPTLTCRFAQDASASGSAGMQGVAGAKNTPLTGITLAAGVDVWLIFSWATGTGGGASGAVFRSADGVDNLGVGMSATRAAYQPSLNVGSAVTFTAEAVTIAPILTRLVLP